MIRPAIPTGGLAGWRFLEATYDRQRTAFANASSEQQNTGYLRARLSAPIKQSDFLADRRLLGLTLTAFGLQGEEWKRGFLQKLLKEDATPGSTFVTRLNNPEYARFAGTFSARDGVIRLSQRAVDQIVDQYETAAFTEAVGESDGALRLALNFKQRIGELLSPGIGADAASFRLLGNIPVRTVLEGALSMSSQIRALPIERQASILKEQLASKFGISHPANLTDASVMARVIDRYMTLTPSQSARPNPAVALLSGSAAGPEAILNLWLSRRA